MAESASTRQTLLLLTSPLLVYAGVCLGMYAFQRPLIFVGSTLPPVPVDHPLITLDIPGAQVPTVIAPGSPMLLWFHGNAEQLGDTLWVLEAARARNFGAGIVDYPGYGLATGSPSEGGLINAGRALADAVAQHLGPKPICAAHSLGTGIAVALAAEDRCSALWLIAPYTALVDVAAHHYPYLPVRLLVRDRMDSKARASKITVPSTIVHSPDDAVIPYAQGQALAAAIPNARLITVTGGHNMALTALNTLLNTAATSP